MQIEALDDLPPRGETLRWWEARRFRYNIGLAVAGLAAWGLFILEFVIAKPILLDRLSLELSLSMTLGQGVAFLVVMAIANLCYLLGVVSEMIVKPVDAAAYRRRMWGLGFWFSVALPFVFPALMAIGILASAGL